MITQKRLKEVLYYDLEKFYWRVAPKSNRVKQGDEAGTTGSDGHIMISVDGTLYKAGRLAFLYMEGVVPDELCIFYNNNPSDYSWENIKIANRYCINRNNTIRKNNTSGVPGVYRYNENKWRAILRTEGKCHSLGLWDNFLDAVRARYHAEVKYKFLECNTNSPALKCLRDHGKCI